MRRHLARKTPCMPILQPQGAALGGPMGSGRREAENDCPQCGRSFATRHTLARHQQGRCKAAQARAAGLADELAATRRELAEAKEELTKCASQGGALPADVPPRDPNGVAVNISGNSGVINIVNNVVNNVVNVVVHTRPWNSEEGRLIIQLAHLAAVFKDAVEYSQVDYRVRGDPNKVAHHVASIFTKLVQCGHENPAARNVHLNPNQANQARVFDKSRWDTIPLSDAIRQLCDDVYTEIDLVIADDKVCGPLGDLAGNMAYAISAYGGKPDAIVAEARGALAAHLGNMAPAREKRRRAEPENPADEGGAPWVDQLSPDERAHLERRAQRRERLRLDSEKGAAERARREALAREKEEAESRHKARRRMEAEEEAREAAAQRAAHI